MAKKRKSLLQSDEWAAHYSIDNEDYTSKVKAKNEDDAIDEITNRTDALFHVNRITNTSDPKNIGKSRDIDQQVDRWIDKYSSDE